MSKEHILQLDPDEQILLTVKRSLFGILHYIFAGLVGLAFLFAALFVVGRYSDKVADTLSPSSAVLVSIAIAVVIELVVYVMLTTYFRNLLIITEQSIVQRLQYTPFNFKTSQLSLSNIEDVTYVSNGLFPTLFNFGTVKVETAGEQVNFVFTFAKNPRRAVEVIIEAKEAFMRNQGGLANGSSVPPTSNPQGLNGSGLPS